ncbi:hypothetical protein ACIBCM_30210 [Streptomyces sp. NPDC051018]|uniref:hypothetical protein n=1 Tax=Streptomyces sp. NPDC051018 TaxID=3365639 RepID=UPI00378CC107
MKQPQAVTVSVAAGVTTGVTARGAAWRGALIVVVALLALLGMSAGSGAPAAEAAEPRTPASAPADPGGAGPSEETDPQAAPLVRVRAAAGPIAPDHRRGKRSARPVPYREGHPPPVRIPVRCVVLRC